MTTKKQLKTEERIKKVRKEMVFDKQKAEKDLKAIRKARQTINSRSLPKLPKNFGKLEQELNDLKADTQHYKLTEKERKEYFSAGFKSGKEYGLKTVTPINNTTEIKEEKNHAITLIIVWLAILTVLAIYVSIK